MAETIISDIKGTFKFRPGSDDFRTDSTATYYYRDSYFTKPSTVITATGEGAMSYSVEEYSTLNGEFLRSVAYLDIPLYEGKTFNATVPGAMNASQNDAPVVYPLAADGEELTPNVDATADEVDSAKCNVEVQLDGGIGGIITGAEEYLIGTRANLTANPFECYTFVGWYFGDEKISDELQYSFVVKEDVFVTAKFAQNHTPNDDYRDCTTAIICSVCGVEVAADQKHIWDDVSDKYCNNAGCEVVNPNYESTDKNTDAKNFIDSIADKIGVTSDQLLMIAGGSLAALVLLIIVIAAIKRKRR